MMRFLGFDTSNYTTSAALYDAQGDEMHMSRRLLPVREGQLGLRQSDAVFHHTAALPEIVGALPAMSGVAAVGVSARPRDAEGSYMPCFLTGVSAAYGSWIVCPSSASSARKSQSPLRIHSRLR